jgi:anti-anti-sigma factor
MTIVPLPSPLSPRSRTFQVVHRHGQRVVCLSGEQDVSTVGRLSAELAKVMRSDERDVVVDLQGVLFMDASTVGAFERARAFLAARGRELHLQSPSPTALRVLRICGIAYDTAPAPGLHIVKADDTS